MIFSNRDKCRSVIFEWFSQDFTLFTNDDSTKKKNVTRLRLTRLILKHEILKSLRLHGSTGFFLYAPTFFLNI